MRNKLPSEQWPAEWVLVALVLATVLGYLGWTVLPQVVQGVLVGLGIMGFFLIGLGLLIRTIQSIAKDQEEVLHSWQHFAEQENLAFQLHPWRSPWSFLGGQKFCECAINGLYRQRRLTVEWLKIYLGRHTLYATRGSINIQNPTGCRFTIKRRGISSLFVSVLGATKATVVQRELDIRFVFEGQPANCIAQILQNQQIEKMLLDPVWLSGLSSTDTDTKLEIKGETLTFQAPACHTEDELRLLLDKVYALAPILEQELALLPK